MKDKTKAYIVVASFVAAVITSLTGMFATSGVAMMICGYFLGSIESQSADKKESP